MASTTDRRVFRSIRLTTAEKQALDDGQGWYRLDDEVFLGGYVDPASDDHQELSLSVNGTSQDNWTAFHQLPQQIQARIVREG